MSAKIIRLADYRSRAGASSRAARRTPAAARVSFVRALMAISRALAPVAISLALVAAGTGCHPMKRGPNVDADPAPMTAETPAAITEEPLTPVKAVPAASARSPFYTLAESARAKGDLEGAREALTKLLTGSATVDPAERSEARRMLSEVSAALLAKGGEKYTVKYGDSLSVIAKKHGTSVEALKEANGLKSDMIRAGQTLRVASGPVRLQVVKSAFALNVWMAGKLYAQYEVGLGRDGSETPAGTFEVRTKVEKPTWFHDGRAIPYGDAKNPLGERWMGFKNTEQHQGYGIHGTTDPTSVGKAESNGCIRLRNEDVIELFRLTPRGTVVEVKD
ncbi:MAG: L,D-transpeptidase family protein [Planctomycetes bacterium]|nr:L,D-transpeptidase family protein [Planctomycetota bacterium]